MKHRIFLILAILSVFALFLCGCGEKENTATVSDGTPATATSGETSDTSTSEDVATSETADDTDYEAVYAPILENLQDFIKKGAKDDEDEEYVDFPGRTGIAENTYGDELDLEKSIGYAITDITSDGIPELLIGFVDDPDAQETVGSVIYTIYGYNDGNPVSLFDGATRYCYQYAGDANFVFTGSDSAASSIFASYTVSEDGCKLSCNDYYFSYPANSDQTVIELYHNTTGDYEPENSEKLDMDETDFWQMQTDLLENVEKLPLTPFADYNTAN